MAGDDDAYAVYEQAHTDLREQYDRRALDKQRLFSLHGEAGASLHLARRAGFYFGDIPVQCRPVTDSVAILSTRGVPGPPESGAGGEPNQENHLICD